MINLVLNANGEEYETAVAPYHTPHDVLREELGFTDVKKGGGVENVAHVQSWLMAKRSIPA